MKKISLLLMALLLISGPIFAGSGGDGGDGGSQTGGSTEGTQIANNIELVAMVAKQSEEVSNQLKIVQNMVSNSTNIPDQLWENTMGQLQSLSNVVRQGQALSYSLSNIDETFKNKFKSYAHYLENTLNHSGYSGQYQEWSSITNDSIRGSLSAANLQYQQFQDEDDLMIKLQEMSETSEGRLQALQVGNQIAAHQVRQTQKLRQLSMSQIQMQASFMADQTNQATFERAKSEQFYTPQPTKVGDELRF